MKCRKSALIAVISRKIKSNHPRKYFNVQPGVVNFLLTCRRLRPITTNYHAISQYSSYLVIASFTKPNVSRLPEKRPALTSERV